MLFILLAFQITYAMIVTNWTQRNGSPQAIMVVVSQDFHKMFLNNIFSKKDYARLLALIIPPCVQDYPIIVKSILASFSTFLLVRCKYNQNPQAHSFSSMKTWITNVDPTKPTLFAFHQLGGIFIYWHTQDAIDNLEEKQKKIAYGADISKMGVPFHNILSGLTENYKLLVILQLSYLGKVYS